MSFFYQYHQLAAVAFALAVLVFFGTFLILSTAGATAQELPHNQTTPSPEQQAKSLEEQLYNLDVHDYEFKQTDERGHYLELEVTWNGRSPEWLTTTQITGGSDVSIERNRLKPDDRTRLTIDLVDDSGVVVYTDESLEKSRAVYLEDESNFLIDGPWSSTDAQIAGLAGLLAGLLLTSLLAYRKVSSDQDEPERVL